MRNNKTVVEWLSMVVLITSRQLETRKRLGARLPAPSPGLHGQRRRAVGGPGGLYYRKAVSGALKLIVTGDKLSCAVVLFENSNGLMMSSMTLSDHQLFNLPVFTEEMEHTNESFRKMGAAMVRLESLLTNRSLPITRSHSPFFFSL